MRTRSLRARPGFTLAETILSMTLMLILIGLSTQLFRKQSAAVSTQAGRLDAQSNSRYALSLLDRELRVAGVGVVDAQPLLVAIGPLNLTFNADLVSVDTVDAGAVYYNPDADSLAASVMRASDKYTLPGTTLLYPDTTYTSGNTPSNAETITYWLSRDSTSTASNEYILFRRVNARPTKVVARGIIYNGISDPIFQYYRDSSGTLILVPGASLPMTHTARIHGAANDTGRSAMMDSIKQVKVSFNSVFHDPRTPGAPGIERKLSATIHLMNAGLIHNASCGSAPLPPTSVTAAATAAGGGNPAPYVTVTWSASIDEAGGERDVQRYAVYRRLSSQSSWVDPPFTSVSPGSTTYSFRDNDVTTGQSMIYGIAAQDCTPALSTISAASTVTIP